MKTCLSKTLSDVPTSLHAPAHSLIHTRIQSYTRSSTLTCSHRTAPTQKCDTVAYAVEMAVAVSPIVIHTPYPTTLHTRAHAQPRPPDHLPCGPTHTQPHPPHITQASTRRTAPKQRCPRHDQGRVPDRGRGLCDRRRDHASRRSVRRRAHLKNDVDSATHTANDYRDDSTIHPT